MVQIGNIHIGSADTAEIPVLAVGTAHCLWDTLVSRYDVIMATQFYLNYVHDPDFKIILDHGLTQVLEQQVNEMEKELDRYRIPLPERPPKSVRFPSETNVITDEHVFARLFSGIQGFIDSHIYAIRTTIFNDPVRKIFIKYLHQELNIYNQLCKYGKLKGWIEIPPMVNFR